MTNPTSDPEPSVAMTVRLPETLHQDLELAADLDDTAIATAIRTAVVVWLAQRRRDPAFQAALRRRIRTMRALLDQPPKENP